MAIKKITGADIEFGNSIVCSGRSSRTVSSWQACQLLLAEAPGWTEPRRWGYCSGSGGSWYSSYGTYQAGRYYSDDDDCDDSDGEDSCEEYSGYNHRDYGRRWGNYCIYGDMGHCEGCLPESASCFDHVALLHGLYNVIGETMQKANAKLGPGRELFVTANNSDGTLETSWGGHFNVCITRDLFRSIFNRKPHVLGFLASYLAAASVVFGQGHVLRARNGNARFVLSSRAHHTSLLVDPSTTVPFKRPLVNSRDESHADRDIARLHMICFDTTLQHVGTLLRVWLTQAFLAALEEGYCDTALLLDDPVDATRFWSCGFSPQTGRIEKRCRLASGGTISAVELLSAITESLAKMCDAGLITDDDVPGTKQALPLLQEVLVLLADGNLLELAKRLDWALKFLILDREMSQHGLPLNSDEIVLVNQLYSHLDKQTGLYWAFEKSGFVKTCVEPGDIAKLQHEGPEDTRAFARKAIVEKFPESICDVDWGKIMVEVPSGSWGGKKRKRIILENPAGFTKAEVGNIVESAQTIEELCELLGACEPYGDRTSSEEDDGESHDGVAALPMVREADAAAAEARKEV